MPALASAKRCTTTHWSQSPSTASTAASSPGGTSSRSATVPRTPLRRAAPPSLKIARTPAPHPSPPPSKPLQRPQPRLGGRLREPHIANPSLISIALALARRQLPFQARPSPFKVREFLQDPAPRRFQFPARLGQAVRLAPGGCRLLGQPFPAPLELGVPLAQLADRRGELRPLAPGRPRVQAGGLEPFPVGQEPPPKRSHL